MRLTINRAALVALALAGTHAAALTASPAHAGEVKPGADAKPKELSLEPTRRIEFETHEATWMSLDVAPDGRTLVLELLGDLYTLPITGGEAKPLTSGMAFDSQPRFSPDGARIAFLSDRTGAENLWIAAADGSGPLQLSKDENSEFASPEWSADGRFVMVSRMPQGARTFELWMYHVDGGAGVRITNAKADPKAPPRQRHNAIGVVASPDGRYLYYATKRGGFEYNASFPMWQVARRDLVSGDEDVLTSAGGSAFRPALSPDGRRLVYGTRHDAQTGLRLRDLETGEDRWLLYPVQRDDQESRFTRDLLPGYDFTPDGAELVLSYGGRLHRVSIATGQSHEIPFTAKVSQGLGPLARFPRGVPEGPVVSRLIQAPAESPAGDRLAFSALTRLYVRPLAGEAGPVPLSDPDQRAFQPTWSPDGAWIAYVTWSAEGGHVWKARVDGQGSPQQLTRNPAFYASPAWAPDGERIVALRAPSREHVLQSFDLGAPAGMDVVWLPAEGGEARLVIPARGVGSPHFGPEPDRIYAYLSGGPFGGGGTGGLHSVRFDGSDRREHLKVTGTGLYAAEEPVPADDVRLSPDGRWALAHVENQLYLIAVPRVGGDAPTVNVDQPSVPVARLTDVGADYFAWLDAGHSIGWAIGSTWYRRPLESVRLRTPPPAPAEGAGERAAGGVETAKPLEEDPSVRSFPVRIEVPRSTPSGRVVLRGARVVTMRGDEVIEDADVVVNGNRIESVGPGGDAAPPEGAEVIDVAGKTILPGFVDAHAHWTEIRRGVLDVQNWSFLANLAYGVTAGLDVQTMTNDMFAYQDLVDAGEIPGPRAFSTGPGIFSDNAFTSKQQVLAVMRRYKEHYGTTNLKSYVVGNRRVRQWVVEAAHELGMTPTTEGSLDLKLDLTHVIDGFGGNEHALPIVPLYEDVVRMFAESDTSYVPTLIVAYGGPFAQLDYYTHENVHDDAKLRRFVPHSELDAKSRRVPWFHRDEHVYPKLAAQAAKIVRAGGRVGIGSHGELQGLGYHWEMWSLASGGLTPMEVLRAATLHGAEIIGYARDIGSLEPGKLADLIVLDGNPLEDIRRTDTVRYVMKNGELYEGDTLDRVWPEPRPLPPLWWWSDEPATVPR